MLRFLNVAIEKVTPLLIQELNAVYKINKIIVNYEQSKVRVQLIVLCTLLIKQFRLKDTARKINNGLT